MTHSLHHHQNLLRIKIFNSGDQLAFKQGEQSMVNLVHSENIFTDISQLMFVFCVPLSDVQVDLLGTPNKRKHFCLNWAIKKNEFFKQRPFNKPN